MKIIRQNAESLSFEESPLYAILDKSKTRRAELVSFIVITLLVVISLINNSGILVPSIYIVLFLVVFLLIEYSNSINNNYTIKVNIDRGANKLIIESSNTLLTWLINFRLVLSGLFYNHNPQVVELKNIIKVEFNTAVLYPFGLGKFTFILSDDKKIDFYTSAGALPFGANYQMVVNYQKGYKAIGQKIANYLDVPFEM